VIEIVLRGPRANALSMAVLDLVERELDRAAGEPLLVTGEGSAFSSGLDLDELRSAAPSDVERIVTAIERTAKKLFLHPAPTVALVNGHAVAGGCLLAQCCDVRIGAADPRVRIGMTGVAVGLTYPPFVLAVLGRRLSPPQLETVLLGSERHSPDQALRLGLLDAIGDDPRALATSELGARAKLPRAAYAAAKRALREPAFATAAPADVVVPGWTGRLRDERDAG
jgi:enoyl-CoA hydratase/carnithine racemase